MLKDAWWFTNCLWYKINSGCCNTNRVVTRIEGLKDLCYLLGTSEARYCYFLNAFFAILYSSLATMSIVSELITLRISQKVSQKYIFLRISLNIHSSNVSYKHCTSWSDLYFIPCSFKNIHKVGVTSGVRKLRTAGRVRPLNNSVRAVVRILY